MNKLLKSPLWMVLFFLLLILNIITIVLFIQSLKVVPAPIHHANEGNTHSTSKNYIVLDEDTVANYLKVDDKNVTMHFNQHHIEIVSKTKVYGIDVKTWIDTKPDVTDDGNLILNIENVEIGQLPLSKKHQLQLIKKYGDLPNEVQVDVQNKRFIYQLETFKFGKNQLKLKKINANKQWVFELNLKE